MVDFLSNFSEQTGQKELNNDLFSYSVGVFEDITAISVGFSLRNTPKSQKTRKKQIFVTFKPIFVQTTKCL